MDENRKKISRFTLKIQSQTYLPLWSIANEKMIYAAAIEQKPMWGPKMWVLYRIMKIAYIMKISDLIIFFIGLTRSISIWWIVKKNQIKSQKSNRFKRVFAGFGASSEEYFFADYIRQSEDLPLRINWVTHDGLHELGCPSLTSIIYILARNSLRYTFKLKRSIKEISSNAIYFLTICASNIGMYAFYQSYWKMAKERGVNEVTFLALDIPAFVDLDRNITKIYLEHGLMPLSIPIPKLNHIDVLTFEEECYLKSILNDVSIRLIRKKINKGPRKNVLMLLSINVFHEQRLVVSESLIQWANKIGLQIVIRPTRKANKAEIDNIKVKIPNALFDDLDIELEESYNKWAPKLIAAWSSTGLATALDYGCLPISLYDPNASEIWDNMIYPMKNRVLFWPRDYSHIEAAVQSEKIYLDQLQALCSYKEELF